MAIPLSPNIQNMLSQLANRQANMQDLMQTQTGAMPYSIAPAGGIPKVSMGQAQGPAMPQPAVPQNTIPAPNLQALQSPTLPQNNQSSSLGGIPTPSNLVQNLAYYLQNGMLPTPAAPADNGETGSNDSGGETGSGNNYAPALQQAMQIAGVPSSWAPYLDWLVQHESSGDPGMVNRQPVNGEHATGLLQTLPSTFKENAAPGMTNITDPVDNAVAAINYIKNRYGSPDKIPGIFKEPWKGY